MTTERHLRSTSVSALAYFFVALGIYFGIRDVIGAASNILPKSLESIIWLLAAAGFGFCLIAEGVLLVKHRHDFRAVAPAEIDKSDLIKVFINFLLTLFFSYVIYQVVIARNTNLEDPLAYFAVAAMVYIATAALCRNIRYIPLFFIFLRRNHDRV